MHCINYLSSLHVFPLTFSLSAGYSSTILKQMCCETFRASRLTPEKLWAPLANENWAEGGLLISLPLLGDGKCPRDSGVHQHVPAGPCWTWRWKMSPYEYKPGERLGSLIWYYGCLSYVPGKFVFLAANSAREAYRRTHTQGQIWPPFPKHMTFHEWGQSCVSFGDFRAWMLLCSRSLCPIS